VLGDRTVRHTGDDATVPEYESNYIIRRLLPIECSRLQAYPDYWVDGLETPNPTDEDIDWWHEVFETHRLATEPTKKPKSRYQIRKWLQNPYGDSAQYRLWGNSLTVSVAYNVLAGIAEELARETQ